MKCSLIVKHYGKRPTIIEDQIVKLEWYSSHPLPKLPSTLKVLICPNIARLPILPPGLLYLEVGDGVNTRFVPPGCHIQYACEDAVSSTTVTEDLVSILKDTIGPYVFKITDMLYRLTMCFR